MTIAQGRSCARAELDILRNALENMIDSTESHFREIIDGISTHILAIERNTDLHHEEQRSLVITYEDELDVYYSQRHCARNKLVICIYSICEALLESICVDNHYTIVKEHKTTKEKVIKESNRHSGPIGIKSKQRPHFYLNDYLYTLNPNYKSEWNDALIVSTAIRTLRNYLTHSNAKTVKSKKIITNLEDYGINDIRQEYGNIVIDNISAVYQILNHCCNMLITADAFAINHSKKSSK